MIDALYELRDLAVRVREEDFGKEDLPMVKADLAGRLRAVTDIRIRMTMSGTANHPEGLSGLRVFEESGRMSSGARDLLRSGADLDSAFLEIMAQDYSVEAIDGAITIASSL
ncbi:MAG TPA: hypothetical protein VMU95_14555 [Trebonia sp.]|nr:hypothetical protein [Trebonia sp.]